MTDILTSDFTFPARIYVVGSGPSALEGVKLIPPGAFIIACNRAIQHPIKATIFLAHDPALLNQDWFNEAMHNIDNPRRPIGIADIGAGKPVVPVLEKDKLAKVFPRVQVTFNAGGALYRKLNRSDGVLCPKATVAGMAIQLAYFLGAKEVVTVGVEMKGGYFDGAPHPQYANDKPWVARKDWDWLVGAMRQEGMRIDRIEERAVEIAQEQITDNSTSSVPRFLLIDLQTMSIEPAYQLAERKSESSPDLPTIGYLCMTVDPIDRMNAVFDFAQQDWPLDKKTLYLLYQRDSFGEFPRRLKNNMGLQIVEIDVEGFPWPETWTFKLMAFLQACDCEYMTWWDEDDRYPGDYTRLAMQPILDGMGELAWSWDCIIAEFNMATGTFDFREDWYRSPIGQAVFKTDLLRKYADRLYAKLYEGEFTSPKRKPGLPYGGAQDDQLRQMIQREIDPIPHHRAQRVYFVHSQANSAQLRANGNAIDYQKPRNTEEAMAAQKTRFDFDRSKK